MADREVAAHLTGSFPPLLDSCQYPFTSRHVMVSDSLIHYIDEGSGQAILLIHGVPVSSFVYRHLVSELRADFRCIAPDLPGFGLSQAAPAFGYRAGDHEDVLSELVEKLDLRDLLVMGHDWGGPLALRLAIRHRDRVNGIVLGNTWAWPNHGAARRPYFLAATSGPAEYALRASNLFTRLAIRWAGRRLRLEEGAEAAYCGQHPTRTSRRANTTLIRQNGENVRGTDTYMHDLEQSLPELQGVPVLLTWGARCPIFRGDDRAKFEAAFPRHTTVVVRAGAHFAMEDSPTVVAAAIRTWSRSRGSAAL
jgi:haloalkane dehalogenase